MTPPVDRCRWHDQVGRKFRDCEQPVDLIHARMVYRHPFIRLSIRCHRPSWSVTDRVTATLVKGLPGRICPSPSETMQSSALKRANAMGASQRSLTDGAPRTRRRNREVRNAGARRCLDTSESGFRTGSEASLAIHRRKSGQCDSPPSRFRHPSDRPPIQDAQHEPQPGRTVRHMSRQPVEPTPRTRNRCRTRVAHCTPSIPHAHATSCWVSTCRQVSR